MISPAETRSTSAVGRGAAATIVRCAAEPTALLDELGRIRCHNPALTRLFAPAGRSLEGAPVWSFAHPRHRGALRRCFHASVFESTPLEKRLAVTRHDGVDQLLQIRMTTLLDDPDVGGVLLSLRDVGRLSMAEDRLLHEAVHDRSTGLPGRPALLDRIARSSVEGRDVAVVVLEVDGFDSVRRSFGEWSGQQFLLQAIERIRGHVGPDDLVARLDSDQVGLLLFDLDERSATRVALALEEAFRRPLAANGKAARCTLRVGISPPGQGTTEARERLRRASLATRARGLRSGVRVYDAEMDQEVSEKIDVETGLRRALDSHDELEAHYQPIVELASRRVVAFEALVRWNHPERGLLSAGAFVPHAEESDLIVELGWWVLDAVCADLSRRRHAGLPVVPVHVNVAPEQIAGGELTSRVTNTLERHGCPVDLLHLELTESATGLSTREVASTLQELRDMGVELSIDDFGTGHSSLSYLHRLPANKLKIDRSFVSGISASARQEPLVRSIVAVAHELRLTIVAEGIETESEAGVLEQLGCQLGQGYLFSKPVPAEAAHALLEPSR